MYRHVLSAIVLIGSVNCGILADVAYAQTFELDRQAAVDLALQQNPEVVVAQKVWDAARARVTQARALPDPELELEYEELPGITRTSDFAERSFGATQRVESPLKWWRRGQAASQAAQATRLTVLEMTRLDIQFRVKLAFDRVLFAERRVGYVEQNAQLAQDFFAKAQRRLAAGDVVQLEVLRAEVEAGRAANRMVEARGDLSVAKVELNTLLARPNKAPLQLRGDLLGQPGLLPLEKLQQLGMERRPDLLGADWAVISSHSARSATLAGLMPDLNLGIFRQSIRGATGGENFWRVAVALDFPLWGGAKQRGGLAEAKAVVGQAVAEKDRVRYQVLLQIESALLGVQSACKRVELFEEGILHEAERGTEVAGRSYVEGKVSYLELLDAQKTLSEVREEYVAALFDFRTAFYRLERATGGPLNDTTSY